jgi:DNA-binding response OmpR family regulator
MPHSIDTSRSDSGEEAGTPACSSVHGKRCALIIDTDPASARLCEASLERMGFAIERASTGVTGVVAARGHVPDLIVMDFQLPDASASETIGWLRANQALSVVPILVLGIADGSRLPVKHAHGMAALGKPLTPAAIERAVRGLCGVVPLDC